MYKTQAHLSSVVDPDRMQIGSDPQGKPIWICISSKQMIKLN